MSFLIIHVGGTYFVNHKTKDCFPESAGLLNLPMNEYLKGINSHDLQLFSGDTHYDLEDYHYNREDYHRKQPAAIRRPGTTKERRSKTHSLTDRLNLL